MAPKTLPSARVKIGTFNCKSLSNKDGAKTNAIAHTIKESGAEIVALQEISSLDGLHVLLAALGEGWSEVHTDPLNSGGVSERMAFLFKDNVEAVGACTFTQPEKSAYVGASNILTRAPGYARFTVRNMDIVLLSVHTFQKKPQYECRMLTKMVRAIQATNACKNVVVLGDFNLPCSDKYAFEKMIDNGYSPVLDCSKFTNLNNTEQYDNIWIKRGVCAFDPKSAVVCRDTVPPGAQASEYSDHCMVVADLEIVSPAGDGSRFLNPPCFEKGLKKPVARRFRLASIVCCGNSKIVCDCQH